MNTQANRVTLTLFQKGILLVVVTLAFELVLLGALTVLLKHSQEISLRQANAKEAIAQTSQIYKLSIEATITLLVYGMSRDKTYSARYDDEMREIERTLHTLKVKAVGNPRLSGRLVSIEILCRQIRSKLDLAKKDLDRGGFSLAAITGSDWRADIQKLTNRLLTELNEFAKQEESIELADPESEARSNELVYQCIAVGVVLNIVLAVLLAIAFHRSTTKRLSAVVENTRLLSSRKPLNPTLTGNDEIAHVDKVFHEMAEALEAAIRKEQAVVKNAVDVICSVDGSGNFIAVNPAAHRVWGYQPEELVGNKLMDLVVPDDLKKTTAIVQTATDGKENVSFENRIRRADGTAIDVLWAVHWSPEEEALFCVCHDISERREMERLRQEFVAMVSHDLRTPLTAAQAVLASLTRGIYGKLSEVAQQRVNATERDMGRLVKMINELLDFEKMEAGKLEIDYEPVEIYGLFETSIDAVQAFAESSAVTVRARPTDVELFADPDRLVQVLVNLISNAVKFSPKNAVVTLSAEDEGDTVIVKVADQGRGVPEAMRENIFERFKQVEKSDGKQSKGTGLGLPICKLIVEQHGGSIGVTSEDGKGSTFWFRLPINPPEST